MPDTWRWSSRSLVLSHSSSHHLMFLSSFHTFFMLNSLKKPLASVYYELPGANDETSLI